VTDTASEARIAKMIWIVQARKGVWFEVIEQYKTPYPHEFFSVSANQAALLNFLCETWSKREQLNPELGSTHIYLGGVFNEGTKSMLITEGSAINIAALESTQHEADRRVRFHAIYNVQNKGVHRMAIAFMAMTQISSYASTTLPVFWSIFLNCG